MTLPFENDTGPVIKRLAVRQRFSAQEREMTEGWRRSGGDSIRRLWYIVTVIRLKN